MILGIDLETTSLDTATTEITEIGAVLWDEKAHRPVLMENILIRGPKVPDEIRALTGISQEYLDNYGVELGEAMIRLRPLYKHAHWMVAHNGTGFDRPICERVLGIKTEKWIDTSIDLPFPKEMTTRKLTHLAAEHGFLNPFAHRAVTDVLIMLQVLSCYDFPEVARLAGIPSVRVIADVSFDHREKAKARGYRWDGECKRWFKFIKADQVETEIRDAGFRVVQKEL